MNNEVKTDISEDQRFKGICGLIYKYASAFKIGLLILLVVLFLTNLTRILSVIYMSDIFKAAFILYYSAVFFIVSNYVEQIFGRLRKAETPFMYDIADKMKGLGYVLGSGGIIGGAAFNVFKLFIDDLSDEWFGFSLIAGFVLMVVGLIFTAFAFIFEHGCRLQQESDETL